MLSGKLHLLRRRTFKQQLFKRVIDLVVRDPERAGGPQSGKHSFHCRERKAFVSKTNCISSISKAEITCFNNHCLRDEPQLICIARSSECIL